jgi:hypothetical protein
MVRRTMMVRRLGGTCNTKSVRRTISVGKMVRRPAKSVDGTVKNKCFGGTVKGPAYRFSTPRTVIAWYAAYRNGTPYYYFI